MQPLERVCPVNGSCGGCASWLVAAEGAVIRLPAALFPFRLDDLYLSFIFWCAGGFAIGGRCFPCLMLAVLPSTSRPELPATFPVFLTALTADVKVFYFRFSDPDSACLSDESLPLS